MIEFGNLQFSAQEKEDIQLLLSRIQARNPFQAAKANDHREKY
jgi:hypothetical protein